MTIRHTCVVLALAISPPIAAFDPEPAAPQTPAFPRVADMKPDEARRAVDVFALRMTAWIDALVQPGQRDGAEDELDAMLDDIQDLVVGGELAAAQGRIDDFQKLISRTTRRRRESKLSTAMAAVLRSHATDTEGIPRIPDRATFERLSYQGDDGLIEPRLRGTEYVKFYINGIERRRPMMHFFDTKVFRSHRVYMRAAGMPIERGGSGKRVTDMLGSLCYRPFLTAPDGTRGLYTVEFDPVDAFEFQWVQLAFDELVDHAPILRRRLSYYPVGRAMQAYERDKKLYQDAKIPIFLADDVYRDIVFLPLNRGTGYGRLRLMKLGERPSARDIVLYPTLPNEMPRVAGVITGVRQAPLSHVNLRAVQDGVPNAFIARAADDETIGALIGKYVRYEVTTSGYVLREATVAEVEKHHDALRPKEPQVPKRDSSVENIRPLAEIEFADARSVGVKAANLATLRRLGFPDGTVPDGVAVPFSFYDRFMRHNGLYAEAQAMRAEAGFRADTPQRVAALAALREKIIAGEWPAELSEAIDTAAKSFPEGTKLRCRSSTNNEDLPGFSGAGLYDSFTHRDPKTHLGDTIKKVYASLWNFRAFEEREFYRVDHDVTAMGVLIHPRYEGEQANGVAVTDDVLYQSAGQRYYVNVQVGEDGVTNPDDESIAEELLLGAAEPKYDALVRASNRARESEPILGDAHRDQLRGYLGRILRKFRKLYDRPRSAGEFAMEIEFKITADGKLAIKQARPWVY